MSNDTYTGGRVTTSGTTEASPSYYTTASGIYYGDRDSVFVPPLPKKKKKIIKKKTWKEILMEEAK